MWGRLCRNESINPISLIHHTPLTGIAFTPPSETQTMNIQVLLQSIVTDVVVDPLYYVGYPIEGYDSPSKFCNYYLARTPTLLSKRQVNDMIKTYSYNLHSVNLKLQKWGTYNDRDGVVVNISGQWYIVPINEVYGYRSIQYKGIQT